MNLLVTVGGIRARNSGVLFRYAAISGRGRNPHNARNGVIAIANSGLWFGSM